MARDASALLASVVTQQRSVWAVRSARLQTLSLVQGMSHAQLVRWVLLFLMAGIARNQTVVNAQQTLY